MGRYAKHKRRWAGCQLCNLCETRRNMVFARGKLPCDLLIVGEGPGIAEDVHKVPFFGPAGKLQDGLVSGALLRAAVDKETARIAFTNLVACLPKHPTRNKAIEPTKQQIAACRPRLEEFVKLARPKIVVAAGDLAFKYLDWVQVKLLKIPHPSRVLQADITQVALLKQRTMVVLQEAFEELYPSPRK